MKLIKFDLDPLFKPSFKNMKKKCFNENLLIKFGGKRLAEMLP